MKIRLGKLMSVLSRELLQYVLIIVTAGSILLYRLGTLVPGLSDPERNARAMAASGKAIIENPLFLPHKLIMYGFIKSGNIGAFWMRLPSVFFACLALFFFYRILRTWYTTRVALVCSFLLLTSAWFLHFARLGVPAILYTLAITLVWAGIRLKANTARLQTVVACCLIFVTMIYIPGFIWLIVPIILWQGRAIRKEIRRLSPQMKSLIGLGFIIATTPLLYAFIKQPLLIREWLVIPENFSWAVALRNAWHLPLWFAIRGPVAPIVNLGRVPLLDAFNVAMFILGAFALKHYLLLDRVRVIIGLLIAGVLFAILNGSGILIMIAPIVYLVSASGIALFLQQWFTVFPRNPLARGVGIALLGIVIVLAGMYHLNSYFLAWPNAPETKQAFQIKS